MADAYTEVYISELLWPEFRKEDYIKALDCYTLRERRYGLVSEQITK